MNAFMTRKIDCAIGALAGFLTGLFAIPTLIKLGPKHYFLLMALPFVAALLWVLGLWIGKFLSRWIAMTPQLARFAEVGFLNTAIDFGVLNIISSLTGIEGGYKVGGVNVPGFALAVVNAYFWNKYWVFEHREGNFAQGFAKFLAVSIGGLLINTGLVVLITLPTPPLGLGTGRWLNIAKIIATVASSAWNLIGYKIVVFKEPLFR